MGGSNSEVYYDQKTNNLINSSNVAGANLTTIYPKIFRLNEHAIIRNYIYSDASTETQANLAGLSFTAKIGSRGSSALITNSNAASFNLTSDWASANVNSGHICFSVNTAGTAIDTALGTLDSKQYSCHILGTDGDGDDRTVAQYYITLVNVPD